MVGYDIMITNLDMKCGECQTEIDMGMTYKQWDGMLFYMCVNENCGVSLPMRGL